MADNTRNISDFDIENLNVRALLDSLAEGMIIINQAGEIKFINRRMSELSGYNNSEVTNQTLNVFLSEKFHSSHLQRILEYFRYPKTRPMGSGLNFSLVRKDGVSVPVEISLSFMKTKHENVAIGFVTDISKRLEIEDELKQRNLELDAYAHTVAHDLNNTISGLVSMSQFIADSDATIKPKERKDLLHKLSRRGVKLTKVVRELLAFATLRKKDVLPFEEEVLPIVNEALDRLAFAIEENNAKISLPDNLPDCMGYAQWIEEVWYNLLGNAVKYGGNPPEISISGELTDNGFVKYSITDNGEGMSKEKIRTILSSKYKIANDSKKGYGLGISIVKRILHKLDGKLEITSEEGKGSTFSFYLKSVNNENLQGHADPEG